MARKYFGTDGVRGRVGEHPLTVDFAVRLASAAARVLAPKGGRVLLGKDTRLSGYMFESALQAGLVAAGADVLLVGPLPTPGIAYLTQELDCQFGVVISASHNSYEDNGIKFFDAKGGKLGDDVEREIEALIDESPVTRDSGNLGSLRRADEMRERYQAFCASTIPAGMDLDGFKIVIDCAHGAGYKVGPRLLTGLKAEIIPIGCSPNGRNINLNCGSTSPEFLQQAVIGVRADVGIALDGDADRLVMVDHTGQIVDGDQLIYIIATWRHQAGDLPGPVVGTVLSNLGLEQGLAAAGIAFRRANVGDKYVLAMLRETGGILGGETSGHLLCLDRTTTGDALIGALQVLAVMKESGRSLAELAAPMPKYPQVMKSVRISRRVDLDGSEPIRSALARAEERLGGQGRVVLRPSGTEPLIRVMVEGNDFAEVNALALELMKTIEAVTR